MEILVSERTGCLMVESFSPPNQALDFGKPIKKHFQKQTFNENYNLLIDFVNIKRGVLENPPFSSTIFPAINLYKPPIYDFRMPRFITFRGYHVLHHFSIGDFGSTCVSGCFRCDSV
jgi:hypothetical protein